MTERTSPPSPERGVASLLGRERELDRLLALVNRARDGRSGALVVSGDAGVGKTALLSGVVDAAGPGVEVQRAVAAESEMGLPYAGLQLLCGHLMTEADRLPDPQREALETAFGQRAAGAPNPLLVGLGVRGLLTDIASRRPVLCIVDDAQWLDEVSARVVASVARRLGAEGIALVMAMRTVDEPFVDLPQLVVAGLADDDARHVLAAALTGVMDERVRDQLIADSQGNPLALRELPGTLSPAEMAGGFALASSLPLERRIEESLLARLDPLPVSTRRLLLLAAADPTGDTGLLWRASAILGLGPADLDAARQAEALVVGTRVTFRHPLIRSAVYRAASIEDLRTVHAALADATYPDRDPDRRSWHRAHATGWPDEDVAADLEQSAERARTRGGVAAAAAFLERAAELSPATGQRTERLIAAASAKHDAGAPETAVRLLDSVRDLPLTPFQGASIGRLLARAGYALRRDRSAPRQLLRAAQALEPHDAALARDTYMEALSAALYAGRLGEPGAVTEIAEAILAATVDDGSERAHDLLLRGQALLCARGQEAALPTVRRAINAFLEQPSQAIAPQWMWFCSRAAQDVWDIEALRTLAERQVQLARASGVLAVLPMALNLLIAARGLDGNLDAADEICDEIDGILSITGHPLPLYGRLSVAAYRGHVEEVERGAKRLRADAQARGEGYALTVVNFAEAVAYNGAARHHEALTAARAEMPYSHELGHAMRTLIEVVEAATRTGDHAVADEAVGRLADVTRPVGDTDWALAFLSLAEAQVRAGSESEERFVDAIERFDRIRVPMLKARSQLLYGEMLRRQNRRIDARVQLRAAYVGLQSCGMNGFAERAGRELRATGETLRTADKDVALTDQELNIARLARDGLTNREIGAQLFISAHTVEWHLRKVFVKLGVRSRRSLGKALADD